MEKVDLLAIDPGRQGALCYRCHSNKGFEFYPLPFVDSDLNLLEFANLVSLYKKRSSAEGRPLKAYLEKAQSMPGNGGAQMFQYGRSYGSIEAILFLLSVPYEYVHPRTWTKEIHRGMDTKMHPKQKSVLVAQRLFPGLNLKRTERCKKSDEGFIDALLISEFAFRRECGKTLS